MRRALPALAALAVMLLLPGVAAAKGPSAASITGPGLDHAIRIEGYGEGGDGSPLGVLVDGGGFFPEVYGQTPAVTTNHRPSGGLGPRYEVAYTLPGGPSGDSTLRQDLYPYARQGTVTYMSPDQRFWGTQLTAGGWFRSSADLRSLLMPGGAPARAMKHRASSGLGVALGAGAGVALAAVGLALYYRRRTAPA